MIFFLLVKIILRSIFFFPHEVSARNSSKYLFYTLKHWNESYGFPWNFNLEKIEIITHASHMWCFSIYHSQCTDCERKIIFIEKIIIACKYFTQITYVEISVICVTALNDLYSFIGFPEKAGEERDYCSLFNVFEEIFQVIKTCFDKTVAAQ